MKSLPPHKTDIELIATSRDDAAGEAFDKTAKLLGLPYPGGVSMDQLSQKGNPSAYSFPRPLLNSGLEFSFSGLKTAVFTQLKSENFTPHIFGNINQSTLPQGQALWNYCASIQEAICDTLTQKISKAIEQTGAQSIAIVGGVSANSRLRQMLSNQIRLPLIIPDSWYCTDNAAMIGACAYFQSQRGEILEGDQVFSLNAYSS